MKFTARIILVFFFITTQAKAENVTDWLQTEIDTILNFYKNQNLSEAEKFQSIENTIDKNFAGAGIAKFVAGKAWSTANKETKKNYINLFKKHLALNIASMMKGYSDQTYLLISTKKDNTNDIFLIDMEIQNETNSILISWRVKESKNRFYIIDLLVADISLVVTKRSEFNSMLKKIDYDLQILNENLNKQNKLSYEKLIQ